MVVSPLTKDSNSHNAIMKGSALRLLAKVLTAENYGLIDRHYKQGIMDKSVKVQKAALASGIVLAGRAAEYVKKWTMEVQECLKSEDPHVVYLALVLNSALKLADPVMMSKVIRMVVNTKGVIAQCQIVKIIKKLLISQELSDPIKKVKAVE